MKTLSLFLLAASLLKPVDLLRAQSAPGPGLVFDAKKIIFYGYDFSHFRVADAKRYGQDIKKYLFTIVGGIQENVGEEKLKGWLKKDSISLNFDHSTNLNKAINNDAIVVTIKTMIPDDSLQSYINRYSVPEKKGVGHVIIFDCLDDVKGSLSAYALFFDLETKTILLKNWAVFSDLGHINAFSSLKKPCVELIEYLEGTVYREKKKAR